MHTVGENHIPHGIAQTYPSIGRKPVIRGMTEGKMAFQVEKIGGVCMVQRLFRQ